MNYGVQKSLHYKKNKSVLDEFLSYLNIIPFGSESSNHASNIHVDLEKHGKPIGPFDLLLAAVALSKGITLVTNNEKEFKRVKGLRIENWI